MAAVDDISKIFWQVHLRKTGVPIIIGRVPITAEDDQTDLRIAIAAKLRVLCGTPAEEIAMYGPMTAERAFNEEWYFATRTLGDGDNRIVLTRKDPQFSCV